jgi:GTP-binding protein
LAHVSRTPGRTRQINLYSAGEHARLADLPGYGYARVPAAMQKHWQETLAPYLEQRHSLCQLIVVLDCRRGLTDLDLRMLDLAWSLGRPCHVLLNKADKLAAAAARAMLAEVAARTAESGAACQLFSAVDRQGTDELRRVLRRALFD